MAMFAHMQGSPGRVRPRGLPGAAPAAGQALRASAARELAALHRAHRRVTHTCSLASMRQTSTMAPAPHAVSLRMTICMSMQATACTLHEARTQGSWYPNTLSWQIAPA